MRGSFRILDADAHAVEPADLFRPWAEPGMSIMDLPPTTPANPCGDLAKVEDQARHGFDPPSYLRAMDAQGIDAAVLYPSMGLYVPHLPDLSLDASAAACRAYNEWAARYCAHDPMRLAAVGVVPQRSPALAAAVAREAAAHGLVGVMVRPNHLQDANLGDPTFGPLYETLEDTGLILAVHEGLGVPGPTIGSDRFTSFAARHACSHPLEQMCAAVALLLGGALERHPRLRVAFLESGTGWLPYWLHRLDEHREWMAESECRDLSLSPSEYFARQCVISTDPDDALAAWTIPRLGADHVVWASDFPHPDALFPDAADEFLGALHAEGVDDTDTAAVLWDTPRRFYRLESRFTDPAPVSSPAN